MENSYSGRVVVGVGRSLGAYQALRYAVAEARRRNALLLAVRVFRLTTNNQGLFQPDVITGAAADNVNIAFAEALGGIPRDLRVEIRLREGAVARALVSVADRESDLLIIGACGCRRWTRRRHTAIARFCAARAVCPVVIVPPIALARSAHADRLARDTAQGVEDYLCHPVSLRGDSE